MNKMVIGVDIGGSHITCMGIEPAGRLFLEDYTTRYDLDCQSSAESILGIWTRAISDLISMIGAAKLSGIGFAMPGPFDYPGGIAWFKGVQKYESLYGVDIRKELIRRLGLLPSLPIRFLNDASCFAIGEAWMGMASGFSRSISITLGTGFGSAFIADGIPVVSGPLVPESGCVYHLPYGNSIADDHFSTRWFVHRHDESCEKEVKGVKELLEQDPCAKTKFLEFGENLGTFLSPWIRKFEAGCLVIGGNIARSFSLFEVPMLKSLENAGCHIPVFISELGEKAAIAGAARLCDDSFYNRLPFISGISK